MMGRREKEGHVFPGWVTGEGRGEGKGDGHGMLTVPCPQITQGDIKGRGATMT